MPTTITATKTVRRPAKKATVTQAELHDEVQGSRLWQQYLDAKDALFSHLKVPTWGRVVCSFLASVLAGMGAGWGISIVTDIVMYGAIALTGSATFAMVIWCIGLVLAIYASVCASQSAFQYIASKRIDEHWNTATSTVKGWFTRRTVEAA
jgi:hypothetical protein